MAKIGLLSDTHSFLDSRIFFHFENCDEIWHAGDFGNVSVSNELSNFKPLRGVYGNIDGNDIRIKHPKDQEFEMEGLKIWMTHIGGYPNRYAPEVKKRIHQHPPHIFICGHSHILRIMGDPSLNNMLYINPGAAGREGFQKVRTIVKFDIMDKKIQNVQVIELGKRG